MAIEIFSDEWARACSHAINRRPSYREAAANWEGDVVLRMYGDDPESARAVYLDLWHGECREARAAGDADLEAARHVLEASPGAWQQLLQGQLAPLLALVTGRLKVTRGSLTALIPYATAARELVLAAMEVDTAFP